MIILSHRGCWNRDSEKNSIKAFEASFSLGFGVETDLRDYNGEIVISHEIPDEECMSVDNFFKIYNNYSQNQPLALNIKADGLQYKLKKLIEKHSIENYFVFDMSVPDGLLYHKHNLVFFTRQSEYERHPSIYKESDGVWLDEFNEHWIDELVIENHLKNKKKICIVSPELHGRDYQEEWQQYKGIDKEFKDEGIMICTDYPEKARRFFSE
jgi:glycerophosphoryl diester phosphodiesterase